MEFKEVEKDLDTIIDKHWGKEDEHFSDSRYDSNKNELCLEDELREYFNKNKISYKMINDEGYSSPGYENNFMAVAYQVPNGNNFVSRLGLKTIMFENYG